MNFDNNDNDLYGDNEQAANNIDDITTVDQVMITSDLNASYTDMAGLQYLYQMQEQQQQQYFQSHQFDFNTELQQTYFNIAEHNEDAQDDVFQREQSERLSLGTNPALISAIEQVVSSAQEQQNISDRTGDTFPQLSQPVQSIERQTTSLMAVSNQESSAKEGILQSLQADQSRKKLTDEVEEKKSDETEPLPTIFTVPEVIEMNTGMTVDEVLKTKGMWQNECFVQLTNYTNEIAQLEEFEEKKQWNDTLELKDTRTVMRVHDDVLLAIFDAPTDQIVEVGWQPDESRVDRRQLRFIAVLIAKDFHLFKSPGQYPLDSQPKNFVQRVL